MPAAAPATGPSHGRRLLRWAWIAVAAVPVAFVAAFTIITNTLPLLLRLS